MPDGRDGDAVLFPSPDVADIVHLTVIGPGATFSHYEILAPLGKGGMGEVWRARDTRLGREVAIKTLPADLVRNTDRLARFRREARAASALTHPNICVVHDLDESGSAPVIVMELLKGETLADMLGRGPIPIERALDIAMQLADGLDAAHGHGILHRDIKPANIFVTDRGQTKLLDFGLAVMAEANVADALTVDGLTQAGVILGTVAYMSPEQARGETLDARSDLFSLGVVLYEMLTGRPAFSGPTSAAILEQIFTKTIQLPVDLGPAAPNELAAVIDGLLEKDRDHRSSSAHDLRASISRMRRQTHSRATEAVHTEKSIVVLPFENLSADPDNEYFSDGLTDEIITDLSKITGLRTIARSSSMMLKGPRRELKTVAARLDVRYVLEGSVRRAGNAVRVTAQLIDPHTSAQLWAEKYSGTLEDMFQIQEQISRKIVDALKVTLSPEEDRMLAEREIENLQAYECYQRARQEIYKFTREGLDAARELIETAVGIVGDNELLYASLGALHWQYVNAAISLDDGHIARAEELATKVFALNPNSAAGYALQGMIHQNRGHPLDAARCYKKALALDPETYACEELPRVYMCVGAREAQAAANTQLRRDPLSALGRFSPLGANYLAGDYLRVQADGLRIPALVTGFPPFRWVLAMSFVHSARRDEAARVLAMSSETTAGFPSRACRFLQLALAGQVEEAEACFDDDLLARAGNVEYWSWWVSECYALIDRKELAIDWLETAFRRGFWNYPFVARHSSVFRTLDGNPRFEELLGRMKAAHDSFEL